jgi:structural maintenance of chromosome 2
MLVLLGSAGIARADVVTFVTTCVHICHVQLQIPFQVDILRASTDNDTIGAVICRRADAVNAAVVIMAKHTRGAIKEFFVGSATNYCTHHCKQPVLVLHID